MKYTSTKFSLLIILMALFSCSESDSVDSYDRTNWYGTYDIISESCSNGEDPPFEEVIFWQEGPCANCIADMSTTEYRINADCQVVHVTPLSWILTMELNDDLIQATALINTIECTVTYKKRI